MPYTYMPLGSTYTLCFNYSVIFVSTSLLLNFHGKGEESTDHLRVQSVTSSNVD